MLRSVVDRSWRDHRRGLLGWTGGLLVLVAVILAVYPSVRDQPSIDELLASYPESLKAFLGMTGGVDYRSGPGYLASELFSFMVPLLVLIHGIGLGSGAIAGEEERHTLDLLLAHPITRRQLVGSQLVAIVRLQLALLAVLLVSLLAGDIGLDMHVGAVRLAQIGVDTALLGLLFATFALALGAATGRRALSSGVAGATAVAAYLLDGLANINDTLHHVRWLSPMHWYDATSVLAHGLPVANAVVLAAPTLVLAAVAVVTFDRRDVRG